MDIFEQIQKGQLEEILHRAEMLGDEETINKAFCAVIEKGGKANVGEIREWKGGKFRKTPNGWMPVNEKGGRVELIKEFESKIPGILSWPESRKFWDAKDRVDNWGEVTHNNKAGFDAAQRELSEASKKYGAKIKEKLELDKIESSKSESKESSKDSDWSKYDEIRIQALAGKNYSTSAGSIKGTSKEISSLEDAKKKINEELIRGRGEHNFSYNKVKVKVTGWVKGVGTTELGEFNMGVSGK